MRFDEKSAGPDPAMKRTSYYKFVMLGLLAVDSFLLQQFITLNREYLSSSSSGMDIGLTLPGSDIPTTQFVLCALAVSMPCLTILTAHYAFVADSTKLPGWIESPLWTLGVTGAGLALTATFWFMSPVSSVIFVALGFLVYVTYAIAVSVRSRKTQATRITETVSS